ncbi:Ras GTPase activating protein ira2 [Tulasnella sp. 427]|nr:Ras GTPase activating protein ira2 [Tulasnella sp. 427]
MPSFSYSWNATSAQDKLVAGLVNRVSARLPCHSGITLQILEADEAMQQIVETMLQISRTRVEVVMHALSELLERITRAAVGKPDTDGSIPLDVLHSQLYVLKVISAAMTFRWQCHREAVESENEQLGNSEPDTPDSTAPRSRIRQRTGQQEPPKKEWIEPPVLDESVAKYVLSVMVVFLRQTASVSDRPKTSGHMHSVSFPDFQPPEMASPLPPSVRRQPSMPFNAFPQAQLANRASSASLRFGGSFPGRSGPPRSRPVMSKRAPQFTTNATGGQSADLTAELPSRSLMPMTPLTVSSSASSINWIISKYAGKIVFHISSSNWPIVFAKIRNKIHHLAQTNEETPDMVDMKLVACSALDRQKLVQVMQELSSLLVNMKREAQGAVSIALRTALWNWIEYFPNEYFDIFKGVRRLEGAPERVFDMLYNMTENQSKRAFWPTLTILLAASPERLKQATLGVTKSKKQQVNFVETLVKSLSSATKTAEISMVCLIDMCKAAAYLPMSYEQTALRALGPDLADELRNRIYSPPPPIKPFYDTTEMIDVDLYADSLVAIYRFSHSSAIETIYPISISPERSDAVKTCVMKACLTLVTEAGKVGGQPPISSLHPIIGPRSRQIIRAALNRRQEVPGNGPRRPVAKRYNQDSFADRESLMLTIFLLWRADPGFMFYGSTRAEHEVLLIECAKLFTQTNDKTIRMAAFKTMLELALYARSLSEGQQWYDESRTLLSNSGAVGCTSASIMLLDSRDSFEDDRNALSAIAQMFFTRQDTVQVSTDGVRLLVSRKQLSSDGQNVPSAPLPAPAAIKSGFALAEIALVATLTSSEMDIPWQASVCLKKMIEMEKSGVVPVNEYSAEDARAREIAYTALGDSNIIVTGRLAMQKRIRRLLQNMCFPSTINIAIWEECYRRWIYLLDGLTRPNSEDNDPNVHRLLDRKRSPEERQAEWQNLTLFLMSFGGCCLVEEGTLQPLSTFVNPDDLPGRFQRGGRAPGNLVRQFIGQAVDLLGLDSVTARETVKDALGKELHPLLFPLLLSYIDAVVAKVFEQQVPMGEESYLLFIEQCISVLRLLFDRIQNINETAHINVDIGRLVQYLTRYIHRSGTSQNVLLVKMKLAGLLDSLFTKRELLPLRKEVSLRNTLLDMISEWAFEPSGNDIPIPETFATSRMQIDLDLACLRTVVKLLDRLQLQPVDGTSRSESIHVQSRLFYRYFNLFSRALQRWKEGESTDRESIASGNVVRPRASPKDQNALRELIIAGLTNLLAANMEAGLKHYLPMVYNDDHRTRRIFVHVFARVLQQGTSLTAVSSLDDADRYSRLCEMVRAPDMLLALAICEICPQSDVDDMINVLLNIFDTRGALMALLKAMIDRELANTNDEASLFRGNSMCTRLLSAFARLHGYNYLRSLLSPLIQQMSAMPAGHSYELDPSRLKEGENVEENERNLKFICQAFLDVICDSPSIFPSIFREVCHYISARVSAIWPESKYAAVGGFIFLRFICPTIVSPASVDIEMPQDNASIQRGLVLITKVIQNLANNILFGKEAFMMCMNTFLTGNIMPVTRFLSEKYTPAAGDVDQLEWLGMAYDETDHMILHRFFRSNADKVGKELLSYPTYPPSRESEQTAANGKQTWDVLCATLVEIGEPLEIPKPIPLNAAQHGRFRDFMQRNGQRNMDGVKEIFLCPASPVDRSLAFILSLHKLNVETVDLELLAAYILKTLLSSDYTGPFDIIVDCTGFTSSSEVPIQWYKFLIELVPSDILQRWSTTYILNPNTYCQKYLRKLYHLFSGLNVRKQVTAVSSVHDLLSMVHSSTLSLMTYPVGLERGLGEPFMEVRKLDRHKMSVPITLHVGNSHLRITSTKPKQIWGTAFCKLTEIIALVDIDDIYNVSTGHEVNEFVIRRTRAGGTMYFSSPSRDAIVKAIRFAKGKLKADGPPPSVERPAQLGNLSATLLNVGFLNVGSDDESLRGASYDLLYAVVKQLQCDDGLILPADGAFVPSNPAAFTVPFSERIAKGAPHLTLDFLSEFFVGFDKSPPIQKTVCLQYVVPWIHNLSGFQNPLTTYFDSTGAKVRDAIRSMIDITFTHTEMFPQLQRYIWNEVGKLDNRVVNIALDELFRAAIDGGLSSRRCEAVGETLVVLSSINVRGKVLSKLRRVLGKTSTKPTKTLVENPAWNEVAALTRLVLTVMYNTRTPVQTQLFVPEVLHLVTIVIATGPVALRTAVHGIVTNLVQSLCLVRNEDEPGKEHLRHLLRECFKPEILRLFGLAREGSTAEYVVLDTATEQQSIDLLERATLFLIDIVEAGAQSIGLANVWRARWVGLVTSTAFQYSAYIQSRAFVVLGTLASTDVDDDLLYQILVAFRSALATSSEGDTGPVVSMLRCIRRIVPGLPENSRYLAQILWLAVALIQSSSIALFSESAWLLQAALETLHKQGAFDGEEIPAVLLAAREPLEEISSQLDSVLGVSFDSCFSFSLASSVFKGIRHPPTRDAALAVLHTMLKLTARSPADVELDEESRPIGGDAVGYFLALLPLTRSNVEYKKLLQEAEVGTQWLQDTITSYVDTEDEESVPRIPHDLIGIRNPQEALLVISFVVSMANSAHSEKEQELLFCLLASLAEIYPDTMALAFDGVMEKLNDIVSNTKNANLLEACGTIFKISNAEQIANENHIQSSVSGGTIPMGPAPSNYLISLQQLGMFGLVTHHKFLSADRSLPLIKWINELVTRIIE